MNQSYDLIIVGAGPAGLALAHYCCKIKNIKILIIEKEQQIGGCHCVYRTNELFSEHSPRVYTSAYVNFMNILNDLQIPFYDYFNIMKYQAYDITKDSIMKTFTIHEYFSLIYEILMHFVDSNRSKNLTVAEYMKKSKFSNESMKVIDTICRMSDGTTSELIGMNTFLEYLNQNLLLKFYHPNYPNDKLLFNVWSKYLIKNGVEIITNAKVEKFYQHNEQIISCDVNINNNIKLYNGKNFILAIPPKNIVSLIKTTGIINAFGDINILEHWSVQSSYIDYITITFHWNKKIIVPNNYIFPSTEWCIFFNEISDLFHEENSKTIISVSVTNLNNKSKFLNKTANECTDENELTQEVCRQLQSRIPNLTNDYIAILKPSTYYDNVNKKWTLKGTAFVYNINSYYIPFNSQIYTNLYNLGTHNGKSIYKQTTLESAISNSLVLSNIIYPKLNIKMKRYITLKDVILIIILLICCLSIIYYISKTKTKR